MTTGYGKLVDIKIADESWNATVYMIEGLPEWPDLSWHTPKSLRINNGNN